MSRIIFIFISWGIGILISLMVFVAVVLKSGILVGLVFGLFVLAMVIGVLIELMTDKNKELDEKEKNT